MTTYTRLCTVTLEKDNNNREEALSRQKIFQTRISEDMAKLVAVKTS